MKRLAVLVSNVGTGTNLKAIIEGIKSGRIKAEIPGIVCDEPGAPALRHAKENNIPVEICTHKEDLLALLQKINPDYVCLAGWKQIVLKEIILLYPNRILNLHPGLIPDTEDGTVENPDGTKALWNKGMLATKAIQNFFDNHSTYAGSSVHFLTLNFDFGPVLGRVFEKILRDDSPDSLYTRLKAKENESYVQVLEKLTK